MVKTDRVILWGVLGLLALFALCGCCLAAVVFLPFHFVGQGGAAEAAKKFLREDPVVEERIGPELSFGMIPSGSVKVENGEGRADLRFSLKGSRGEGEAAVLLSKPRGKKEWRVDSAELTAGGETFQLKGGPPAEETPGGADQGVSASSRSRSLYLRPPASITISNSLPGARVRRGTSTGEAETAARI